MGCALLRSNWELKALTKGNCPLTKMKSGRGLEKPPISESVDILLELEMCIV